MRLPDDLQQGLNEARAIVRYRFPWWLRLVVIRGVTGITLGRRVYLAGAEGAERTLRHELVHLRQIERLGVLTFYWRWLREYISNRRKGMPSDEAYRGISFEQEAFAAETYNQPRVV